MSALSKRRYVSARRSEAAEASKGRVLDAAKALFAERGIDKVTIAEIARQAGVAASTVYAQFASKAGILRALMEQALFGARFQAAQAQLAGVEDPVRLIALTAAVARAIYESEAEELGLLRGASAFSPELRELEAEFEARRMAMQQARVERLFEAGLARPGLDLARARQLLWMYTSRDIYRMLVHEKGWSPDDFQAWLAGAILEALVAPEALRRGGA